MQTMVIATTNKYKNFLKGKKQRKKGYKEREKKEGRRKVGIKFP